MPLNDAVVGSVGTEIPDGAQVRWGIKDATWEPDGKYGPDFELNLEAKNDEYFGTTAKMWPRVQEPRLDLVRKLRKDEVPDSAIAETLKKKALKNKAYDFKESIDEPDRRVLSRLGGAYKVFLAAVAGGDHRKAEAILKECESFDDLADRMVGGSFVIATKVNDEGYLRFDLREEIYPDLEAFEPGDDLPDDFEDEDEDLKAPF